MAKGDLYEWTTDIVTVLDTGPGDFEKSVAEQQTKIEQELLTRLVALNHERAAEEKRGIIRWLRPDYQNKTTDSSDGHRPTLQQTTLPGTEAPSSPPSTIHDPQSTIAWPAKLPDQVTLIRQLLTTAPTATPEQLSHRVGRKNAKRTEQIEGILETLRGLGQL